ncbi:uncharacterized protein [Narcine bancroftii]|uniref:uncharacterized protein n=1 Tax=Narcine bancroftii TaxID=1343680 RepID=UPI0038310EB5
MLKMCLLLSIVGMGCFIAAVRPTDVTSCVKDNCKRTTLPLCSQLGCEKSYWIRGSTEGGEKGGGMRQERIFEAWSNVPVQCAANSTFKLCSFGGRTLMALWCRGGGGSRGCPPRGRICMFPGFGNPGDPLVRTATYLELETTMAPTTTFPDGVRRSLYERARKQANRHRLGDNLWVDLHQLTVQELGVRNCWICSGPTRDGTWPWRGEPLDDRTLLASNLSAGTSNRSRESWKLENHPRGFKCLMKDHGSHPKGDSACHRWKNVTSSAWGPTPFTPFLSPSNRSDTACVPLSPSTSCLNTDPLHPSLPPVFG